MFMTRNQRAEALLQSVQVLNSLVQCGVNGSQGSAGIRSLLGQALVPRAKVVPLIRCDSVPCASRCATGTHQENVILLSEQAV